MITIKNFLLRIASNLIKLYPPQFHREFSEEIQITLHELLEEYANCGIPVFLMKGLSEIFSLFVSIFRERQRTLNMREAKMKHIQWSWKKVVTTLLPVLLWIGILWFIQPNVFLALVWSISLPMVPLYREINFLLCSHSSERYKFLL